MNISIRKCTIEDASELQQIGYETFDETFRDQNSSENMNAYLEQAFDLNRVRQELSHTQSQFFFVYADNNLAGYLKVNTGDAQSEQMGDEALEIERIYVRRSFQKQGIGQYLFDQTLAIAVQSGKQQVWLGVWEKNENAIVFYRKLGFVQTGAHSFYMGDEEQIDFLMVKDLSAADLQT
ncbi:GNAT family N-acetyltransferase [Paenibacillus bovis]|uniref:GNAT family acetyltransferase n=1 Tax=Paenibacillus bovis TaxID=1616788 RepID=A0A172ZF34_9BACL|nr:N-acetyltransferase [Paenibacillus bovis]ANF96256.1 GNAT family acetyltransferase [Paenibacillus bovis]